MKRYPQFSVVMILCLVLGMLTSAFTPASAVTAAPAATTVHPPEEDNGCELQWTKQEHSYTYWDGWKHKWVTITWYTYEITEVCPSAPNCVLVEDLENPGKWKEECKFPPNTWEPPYPPEIIGCQDCAGRDPLKIIKRADMIPLENEIHKIYTLTARCDTKGFDKFTLESDNWKYFKDNPNLDGYTLKGPWNKGLEACNLAANQLILISAQKQLTAIVGTKYYPLKQGPVQFEVTISGVPDMDKIIIVPGYFEGTFKPEDWNAQKMETWYETDYYVMQEIPACAGFPYTDNDLVDGVVKWKLGSNAEQFERYLVEDKGVDPVKAKALSLDLLEKGEVTLP